MTTFLGNPVTFTGSQLQVGDTAHDFSLTTPNLEKKSLADFAGKKKVLSVIPSIDTGICSTQTRHFNQALSDMEDTVVLTVSVDLPFAQGKWCAAEGIENAIMLSDYFDHSFGKAGRLHPSRGFHLRPIEHVFNMRATNAPESVKES